MKISKEQKVWLVTGSSSGLGKSFVKAIAEQGDFVVATARKKEAVHELEALYPGQVMSLALDVTDLEQIKETVQAVIEATGRIDVLVNNAGYGYRAAIEEGIEEEVQLLFQTNFYGSVMLMPILLLAGCTEKQDMEQEKHTAEFFSMGTYISLAAYGENADAALDSAQNRVQELEALWSVTEESSEIYRINHNAGVPVEVSPETAELLDFALEMARQTDGALDPTIYPLVDTWGFISGNHHIPTEQELQKLRKNVGYEKVSLENDVVTVTEGVQLDLGAIGKGYAGQVVSDLLESEGITSALLDIGGNIQMIGKRPDGEKWRLGIKNPFGDGSIGVLQAEDCAVVTSGGYERYFIGPDGKRYGHILNPQTGMPADSGLASVTVVADNGALCDSLSTALFVMGAEKAEAYWYENGGFDMLLITDNDEILLTEGIADDFSVTNDIGGNIQVLEK